MSDIKIAFETWSGYGNPLFIDNITISQYTDIDQIKGFNDTFTISPNPAGKNFTVSLLKKDIYKNLTIINQLGEIVHAQPIYSDQVQIDSNLAPGIYFVIISGKEKIATTKLLIF
jgi:hypothetical protein